MLYVYLPFARKASSGCHVLCLLCRRRTFLPDSVRSLIETESKACSRKQIRKQTYTHGNTYRSMVYVSLIVNVGRVDQFCGGLCFSICLELTFIYISETTIIRISYLNLCFFIAINLWKYSSRVIFGKELTAGNVLEISVPFPPRCYGCSFNHFGTRNSSLCL